MDSRNGGKNADKSKKNAVPHIKISGAAKSESIAKSRDKKDSAAANAKAKLAVVPATRSKQRDKDVRMDAVQMFAMAGSANKFVPAKEPEKETKVKPKQQRNGTGKSKEATATSNGVNKKDKDKPPKEPPPPPHGKIPMRRCASIDVGELGRKKKKGKRKKQAAIDKDTLIALHTASKENVATPQSKNQRSGSLGNRPNSLKLSQSNAQSSNANANNIFPTPVPSKRHSTPNTAKKHDSMQTTDANSISPDDIPNDTSAILPPKPKEKPPRRKLSPEEKVIELADKDDSWYSTFPTESGYRKHGRKYTFPSSPYTRIATPILRKSCLRYFGFILYAFVSFMIFCPVAALLLVLLPLCIFLKFFLNICCTCCSVPKQGCCLCGQRLSVTERFWIQNELKSPQVVQSLVIVEYGLSVPHIINLVNNRLVLAKGEDARKLYPKFSQKVIPTCADYIWQDDTNFFIHNHVFAMPKGIESLVDLQDYVSDLASKPLDFDRPLWEVQVLTDFGDVRDTVLFFRMHPCLADGVSMVKILYKSIADVDSVTTVPPQVGRESCFDSFRSIFDAPIKFFGRILCTKSDFNLLHGQHIHLSGKKVVTWSEPYSLSCATKIKQVSRSTLNEVFMSVAAGSIRNYLILNGIPHPYDMQTSIPVYYGTNKHSSGVGNDVLLLKVSLPTNTEGVVPRLWQMKSRMSQVRASALFALTRRIFKFSHHMLSESIWNKMWIYILRKCTCIISSLPGPEVNLRMSSKQIKTIFYWFPPVHHVALAISFFTYGDHIQMAVSADRSVLPNPELIAKDFVYQMESLYDQLGHRRIPGEHMSSKKMDITMLNTEIKPEETAHQLQKKMSMIHQELQNLKHKLDARRYEQTDEDHKLMKRIESLKEQFRELLVEMRKRKAAESELAMTFSEEDSTEDDDEFDMTRRPYRRRAMSVSSRISTASVSSTVRPLPAPTPSMTPDYSPDSPLISDKQVPYSSHSHDRKFNTIPYAARRPSGHRQAMEDLEILEYQYSPSFERRQYKIVKK